MQKKITVNETIETATIDEMDKKHITAHTPFLMTLKKQSCEIQRKLKNAFGRDYVTNKYLKK